MNPTTGNQITRYAYGTFKTALSPQSYRNDLLMAEIYPDVSPTNILRATNGSEEKNVEAPVAYRGPASLRWDDFEATRKKCNSKEPRRGFKPLVFCSSWFSFLLLFGLDWIGYGPM